MFWERKNKPSELERRSIRVCQRLGEDISLPISSPDQGWVKFSIA